MSIGYPLVTLAEAKEELREKSQNYDDLIQSRIDGLTSAFEQTTGYLLKERTLTNYRMDGNGLRWMMIPAIPVQSVSQIELRNDWDDTVYKTITDTTKFILITDDEYGISLKGLVKLTEDYFVYGKGNVLVSMLGGFKSTHPKLAEARRLLFMQLHFEYTRWQNNEAGLLAKSFADGSISFAPQTHLLREVTDGLEGLLKSWRAVG